MRSLSAPSLGGAWEFGSFRLDRANQRLWQGEVAVSLRPKTFAVLTYLVEHAGELVSKNRLLDEVWGHRHVSESALEGCISELRKALGDEAKAPRYLETLARRGYRFVAAVRTPSVVAMEPDLPPAAGQPVGREAQLAQLQERWRVAQGGFRQLVFLSGEAGLGKTTLIDTFLRSVAGDRPAVLWGQCIDHFGSGEAFLPLLGALQQRGASVVSLLRARAPAWLIQLPGLLTPEQRLALHPEVLGATRERMLREGCDLLEALCAETPLILVLEDLHWSDGATIDLLSWLGRRRESARLLVLGSYRPSDLAWRNHPLQQIRQELQSHRLCTEIPVGTFTLTEQDAYLAQRFPESRFPEDIARIIHHRTGGHPLFMVNLLDYLLAEGRLKQSGGWWSVMGGIEDLGRGMPDNLRQMIAQQIARLDPDQRRMLEALSAVGVESSAALLAAGLDQDPLIVEGHCETLARRGPMLAAAGIAEWPDGTAAGNYAFRHALYGEVLHEQLSPGYRIALHRRLGERLEAAYMNHTGEIAVELARHFEAGRDFTKAVHYLRQAAQKSAGCFANQEASRYLERALVLVASLPVPQQAQQRYEVLQWIAATRCSMNLMEDAVACLLGLLEQARMEGSLLWEVRALVDLSRMYFLLDQKRCLEWIDQALEKSRNLSHEAEKILVRACHAHWHVHSEWRDEYAQSCREGVLVARQINEPRILARCLIGQSSCECYCSNYGAAVTAAAEGMRWAESVGDGYLYLVCQSLLCMALVLSGRWGEARAMIREGKLAAEKNGNLMQSRRFCLLTVILHVEGGDFEWARTRAESMAEMMLYGGDSVASNLYPVILAQVHLGLRNYSGALQNLQEMNRRVEQGSVLLDGFSSVWLPWILSEYWLTQGELAQARRKAMDLCATASERQDRCFLALGHRILTEIALAAQDWDEADAQVARALDSLEDSDVPLAAWRVYATAAAVCERRGLDTASQTYRCKAVDVLVRLADSLDGTDPLRQSIFAHPLFRDEARVPLAQPAYR